ncbi:MAG: DUF4268 domain-containing protein [Planctomycetales bacterium]
MTKVIVEQNHAELNGEYWGKFLAILPDDLAPSPVDQGRNVKFRRLLGRSSRWFETIANKDGERGIAVSLVLGDDNREIRFNILQMERHAIEGEIGGTLQWGDDKNKSRTIKLIMRDFGGIENKGRWHEQHRWLTQKLELFRDAFAWRLEELDAGEDIAGRLTRKSSDGAGWRIPRQADPLRRLQVEDAAVEAVRKHFAERKYRVKDVSRENLGWDLEAIRGKDTLFIEVKGLSGRDLCVELTPNEYAKMKSTEHCNSWRLCVVTNALTDPQLAIFGWSKGDRQWEDERGRVLVIEERIAARCRAQQPAIAGNASLR